MKKDRIGVVQAGWLAFALISGLSATAPASAQDAAANEPPSEELVAEGEGVFRRCAGCHAIGEGAEHKVGPHLNGVIGRTAGTAEDYTYSDAMVEAGASGLVWDEEETLPAFLANPKEVVEGTKMVFAGLKKEEDIAAVIAYIEATGGVTEGEAGTAEEAATGEGG